MGALTHARGPNDIQARLARRSRTNRSGAQACRSRRRNAVRVRASRTPGGALREAQSETVPRRGGNQVFGPPHHPGHMQVGASTDYPTSGTISSTASNELRAKQGCAGQASSKRESSTPSGDASASPHLFPPTSIEGEPGGCLLVAVGARALCLGLQSLMRAVLTMLNNPVWGSDEQIQQRSSPPPPPNTSFLGHFGSVRSCCRQVCHVCLQECGCLRAPGEALQKNTETRHVRTKTTILQDSEYPMDVESPESST